MLRPLLAVALCSLAGCATSPQATDSAPADFVLSLEVRSGVEGLPPAWYTLEADGALRAALGLRTDRSPAPPRVRTLTRPEVDALWMRARETGALADAPAFPHASDGPPRADDPGGVILFVSSSRRRRTVHIEPAAVEAPLRTLAGDLQHLAWVQPPQP